MKESSMAGATYCSRRVYVVSVIDVTDSAWTGRIVVPTSAGTADCACWIAMPKSTVTWAAGNSWWVVAPGFLGGYGAGHG